MIIKQETRKKIFIEIDLDEIELKGIRSGLIYEGFSDGIEIDIRCSNWRDIKKDCGTCYITDLHDYSSTSIDNKTEIK